MSKRELLTGIWLMSMALLSLFTFTVFFVAQMSPDILDIVCPILAAVQCITLVIYLWGPEKLKYKPLKILYRLMYATSILVIPVFIFFMIVLLFVINYTLYMHEYTILCIFTQ